MCEFCIRHGEGKKWYEVMSNYSQELYAQGNREGFMVHLLSDIHRDYAASAGKLDWVKRKLPLAYRFIRRVGTWKMKRDHFGQVVPLEDAEMIVDMVQSVTRLPCVCRGATRGRREARYCLALGVDVAGVTGGFSDLTASLEVLTPQQAKDLLREFDREGLIHSIWTFKTPFIGGICNCDQDCLAYRTQVTADLMQVMFKGEYLAEIDPAQCTGCRSCLKLCQFGAIQYSALNSRCAVNPLKCYGCGVCRSACQKQAISLADRQRLAGLKGVW
ncbi:MAG: 4Fe-4S ferredoxin [Firmicutes bacterium HGW-Firmicutes-8]|nr:MAG: 4Fe-4S ferredoxin [Firmicutes bacterium HGW-Firmicutes-8]